MAGQRVDIRIGAEAVPVGSLIVEPSGSKVVSHFRYHDSWLTTDRSFALCPDMPVDKIEFFNRSERNISSLPGPLSDVTPDSWGRKLIRHLGDVQYLSEMDYLTLTDDFLRTGALRIFDRDGSDGRPLKLHWGDSPAIPRIHDLSRIVEDAIAFDADPFEYASKHTDAKAGQALLRAVGSLGGARPKVNVIDENGDLWIVKIPKSSDHFSVERVEVMMLRLAGEVGIRSADAVIANSGVPVSMIRRFDRKSGTVHRIPFISAQTFLGKPGTEPGTYEEIAAQLRIDGCNPVQDIPELFRRLMFNVLIRNTDDHLRNHGLLRAASGWALSPAYDINPERSGAYLQTGISEIHGYEPRLEIVLDASEYFDVNRNAAEVMAGQMGETIRNRWRQIGREVGMTSRDFSAVSDIIENDELEKACRLISGSSLDAV